MIFLRRIPRDFIHVPLTAEREKRRREGRERKRKRRKEEKIKERVIDRDM